MNRASLLRRAAALVMAPSLLAKLPAPAAVEAGEFVAPEWLAPSTTFLSVATPAYFLPNDILRNTLTGENMRVTKVLKDGLTVERGIGTIKGDDPLPPAITPELPPATPAPIPGNFAWMDDELTPRFHPPYVLVANLSPHPSEFA